VSGRAITLDGDIPGGVVDTSRAAAAVQAEVHRPAWDACRHRQFLIEHNQRLVKCQQCGMLLDPVWCLEELIYHFQTSPNAVLQELKDREKKEAERKATQKARAADPKLKRGHLRNREREELERAAHNAHQATLLAIRSGQQLDAAAKIRKQLDQLQAVSEK
jgi:phosphoenolpyruvate synthase/pyruvate phosphate dikinase